MNETLKVILSLSLSGSLLILLLFLPRPLFKERLSKQWQYYIWLVVIARLILPFAPDTNMMATLFQGIDRAIEQTEIVSPYTQQGGIANIPQTDEAADEQNNLHSRQTEPAELVTNPVRNIVTAVWKNLWLGWLVVALILFIRKITVYQDFVKYIRAGCVEVADIELLERFGKLVERNKVKITIELYTNNLISSPLLIGFFRPSIVLPSADLSPVDFEYTILHELTHYKRRDMFYKWLVQFSVCVHWFNPLVYLMSREVGRACELSCDETVIRALDLQGRRAYGDTLLNAMGAGGNYKDSVASVTLYESKVLLKERLDAIMRFKKKSGLVICATGLLTVLFLCGFSFVGVYAGNFKADTSNQFQSIKSTITSLNKEQEITVPDIQTHKTVLEMEMDANYSSSDPFENGRLFCVSEDIETLDVEVYFQMDGESGIVEIKDRDADEVLWSNTWDENVNGDTIAVSLTNLQKEKEYVVRFTGTKINYAVVKVTFESELVQEKSRPSK